MAAEDARLVTQVVEDLKEDEGFREFAYPDPLSYLGKKYPSSKYKWGFKSAREILTLIGEQASKGEPWTYGFGFTSGVTVDSRITLPVALNQLKEKVIRYLVDMKSIVPNYDTMPFAVQTVLLNMTYNLGRNGLAQFKNTIRYLSQGNYDQAAANLEKSLWYRQVGVRAKKLVRRIRTQQL